MENYERLRLSRGRKTVEKTSDDDIPNRSLQILRL